MKIFKTFGAALAQLNAYQNEHGKRYSPVREMVLEQICLLPQPFTAEDLTKACEHERISKATVYNSLELFEQACIIRSVSRQRGQRSATVYGLSVGNTIRMQVVCKKCGRISNFRDAAIERIIREHKYTNFNMQHFTLYVFGECRRCKQKKLES